MTKLFVLFVFASQSVFANSLKCTGQLTDVENHFYASKQIELITQEEPYLEQGQVDLAEYKLSVFHNTKDKRVVLSIVDQVNRVLYSGDLSEPQSGQKLNVSMYYPINIHINCVLK